MSHPPPFVGSRSAPVTLRAVFRGAAPWCVQYARLHAVPLDEDRATADAQFWHDVAETEHLGGCQVCVLIETSPRYQDPGPGIDVGAYANDAGRELVARGVWDDDTLLTAAQLAEKYAHGKVRR